MNNPAPAPVTAVTEMGSNLTVRPNPAFKEEKIVVDPATLTHKVRIIHEVAVDGERHPAGRELNVTEKHFGALSRYMELLECPATSRYADLAKKTTQPPPA